MNTKCIVCDKELELDPLTETENASVFPALHGGVIFRSTGQYGSRVIDSAMEYLAGRHGTEVQIIICDQCIVQKSQQVDCITDWEETKTAKYTEFDGVYSAEDKQGIINQLIEDGSYSNMTEHPDGSVTFHHWDGDMDHMPKEKGSKWRKN